MLLSGSEMTAHGAYSHVPLECPIVVEDDANDTSMMRKEARSPTHQTVEEKAMSINLQLTLSNLRLSLRELPVQNQ